MVNQHLVEIYENVSMLHSLIGVWIRVMDEVAELYNAFCKK